MSGKSMVLLLLAVMSGLGATYGTSRLLSKNNKKMASEMQDVLVAARDIKAEELVKPELVKVVKMSKHDLPAGVFTSYKDVEDRWVQIKTLEGEPILDRKLAPKGSPAGLVSRIPAGMRAFALDVNESTGVSGFVLPDYRVDVVQVMPGSDGKQEAETILQDVLVLASGQVFSRPEDRSLQSRTVTLAVTPEQVDTLVAARTRGPLSLALRGLNDHVQVEGRKSEPPRPIEVSPPDETEPASPAGPTSVKLTTARSAAAPPPPAAPAEELMPPLPPAPPRRVAIYRGPTTKPQLVSIDGSKDENDSEILGAAPGASSADMFQPDAAARPTAH